MRDRMTVTPECVRSNPLYITPEGEGQSARRRRLRRKREAIRRALSSSSVVRVGEDATCSTVSVDGEGSLGRVVTPDHVRSNQECRRSGFEVGLAGCIRHEIRGGARRRLLPGEANEVGGLAGRNGAGGASCSIVSDGFDIEVVDGVVTREVGGSGCLISNIISWEETCEREDVSSIGLASGEVDLATPEVVRINPSYMTPATESRSARTRRLRRRYYAKRRYLERVSAHRTKTCLEGGGLECVEREGLVVEVGGSGCLTSNIISREETCERQEVSSMGLASCEVELATPEMVRSNPSYRTPDIESRSAKTRRLRRRYYAKRRYLERVRAHRTETCLEADGLECVEREGLVVEGTCTFTTLNPIPTVDVSGRERSPFIDQVAHDRLEPISVALVTPEEVRTHPSYRTPEVESRSARSKRLKRKYYAKRRFLDRVLSRRSIGRLYEVARSLESPTNHDLGRMIVACEHCLALRWNTERNWSFCCMRGKVRLPLLPSVPRELLRLYTSSDDDSIHFRKYVRSYNNSFAFASLGVNLDRSTTNSTGGAYTFRVSGRLYHQIGGLLASDSTPLFSQIYIVDGDDLQVDHRLFSSPELRRDVLSLLHNVVMDVNPFAQRLKNVAQIMRENATRDIRLRIVSGCSQSRAHRQFNAPTSNEIAVLMPLDDCPNDGMRDIILHSIQDGLQRITQHHSSYDSLHFVLLLPYGTDGWYPGICHVEMRDDVGVGGGDVDDHTFFHDPIEDVGSGHKVVTIREFYCYHLHIRTDHVSPIHLGGRLFQEYMCDMVAKMVQNNMNYIYNHQQSFRREIRSGVVDALRAHSASEIGQRVVLPSSYIGSPRHMIQQYQDAMAVVRELGSPDLFITMTANPNWIEIKRELQFLQTPADRPDLVSRIFNQKLQHLLHLLKKDGIFGRVVGRLHVVEFQKRGLPHAHLLIILEHGSKPITVGDYDRIVCAEIPSLEEDPDLYEIVKSCMLHGPCGTSFPNAPCMKDGKCSKNYPRSFIDETIVVNGYLSYRRRDNGVRVRSRGVDLDNRWVVPYNRWLALHFRCHINVEICVHIRSVKYLYKYVYKGPDMITATTVESGAHGAEPVNEIEQFLNARYFSASEACWRLFGFSMGTHKPVVTRLAVHLSGGEFMYFSESADLEEVSERRSGTTLTAMFDLNRSGDVFARELLYQDLPRFYVYNRRVRRWTRRVNAQSIPTIGRMFFVHPSEGERFYLRVLLAHVRGATGFEDLRTFEGELCASFREACTRRLLINDAMEWRECLREAVAWGTPSQLRLMFAVILLTCGPSDPLELWRNIETHLVEDYAHDLDEPVLGEGVFVSQILIDRALLDVESHMQAVGKSLVNFGFTLPEMELEFGPLFREEMFFDESISDVDTEIIKLNIDQRRVFDRVICGHVLRRVGGVFFVDGPGGTGKTFLYNVMLSYVRAQGWIALAVASSGIAALLMKGGRTAHSRFRIPPTELNESSTCSISKQSPLGRLLMACRLIIWDEAPMMHRFGIECVDRSLRDILGVDVPFGGVPVVFGGDFCQILPVVRRGSRAQIVSASLKCSPLWKIMEVHRLSTNMRVMSLEGCDRSEQLWFADYLLRVGEGREPIVVHRGSDLVSLPESICIGTQHVRDLISFTFPDLTTRYIEADYLSFRAILCPLNEDVDDINARVIAQLPGEAYIFYSADSVVEREGSDIYPVEFLNSLQPSGCPPHKLVLKVGMIVMLLRSVASHKGLCNGTRLIIRRMGRQVLEAEIVTGKNIGSVMLIPRIPIVPSDSSLPFELQRVQFPIRAAFAMTINKAQGQTMDTIGLYLPRPVFSHGQLYVALSRVRTASSVRVLIVDSDGRYTDNVGVTKYTQNIVYPEVL